MLINSLFVAKQKCLTPSFLWKIQKAYFNGFVYPHYNTKVARNIIAALNFKLNFQFTMTHRTELKHQYSLQFL